MRLRSSRARRKASSPKQGKSPQKDTDDAQVTAPSHGSETESESEGEDVRAKLESVTAERDSLREELDALRNNARGLMESKVAEVQAKIQADLEVLVETASNLYSGFGAGKRAGRRPHSQSLHKEFVPRESLLTQMLTQKDFETIFNICISFMVMLGISISLNDYWETQRLVNLDLLYWCFRGFDVAFGVWFVMVLFSFLVLPIAHYTARSSRWKWFGIVVYCLQQGTLYFGSAAIANVLELPPATGMFLMCEQTRISMKIHAYFREKLMWKKSGNSTEPPAVVTRDFIRSEVGLYFYFLWVPTLVYRTQYPQTPRRSYTFILVRLLECLTVVYYVFLVFRHSLPQIERTTTGPDDLKHFVFSIFNCMLPGMALMILAFFLLLHSWQNLWAEITGFADRQFYSDWWNTTNWAAFYRKWNGVVHDHIHSYIYGDLVELFGWKRSSAMLMSFFVSAVIHEWIVTFAIGFFFPILFVLFGGPGVLFISLTKGRRSRFWNTFMWLNLALGNGVLIVLYVREFHARQANPPPPFPRSLIPWSWYFL